MGYRFAFPIPLQINDFTEPGPYLALSKPALYVHAEENETLDVVAQTGLQPKAQDFDAAFEFLKGNACLDRPYQFQVTCSFPSLISNEKDFFSLAIVMSAKHIQHKRFNRQMREKVIDKLFKEGIITNKAHCLASSIGGLLYEHPDLPYLQIRLPQGIHACLEPVTAKSADLADGTHRSMLLQKACLLAQPTLLRHALYRPSQITSTGIRDYLGSMPTSKGELHLFENKAALDEFIQKQVGQTLHEVNFSLNGFEKS